MNIIPGFKLRGFILTAVFFAGLGFGPRASAQETSFLIDLNSKTVTPLGTLGSSGSDALGVNDAGQVVGYSYVGDTNVPHAFITGPNGAGMRDLGALGDADSKA